MQKIKTATNKEYNILWCGVSSIDGVLRFEVKDLNMLETLAVFTNPEETIELTHIFDNQPRVYHGYTTFKGVDLTNTGIIVSLIGA